MSERFGKNYLGLDWGASKIGVAFADAETRMAFALFTFKNDRDFLDRLGDVFREKSIGTVVIGVASHVNRTDAVSGGERLGDAIRAAYLSIDVAYQEEMFTTKMAMANLREHGIRDMARFDDRESARIILQEWLDRPR